MDFSLRTGFHLAPCRSLASAGLDELAQTLWDSRTDNSLEIPARAGLFTRILKQTYGTALRSSAAIYRPFSSTSILDVMPIVAIWMSSKPPTNRFWPSGMLLIGFKETQVVAFRYSKFRDAAGAGCRTFG